MSARRFVITGLGLMTPLGLDADTTWQGIRQGKSGVGPIRAYDPAGLPIRIAGELPGFVARNYGDKVYKRNLNKMARTLQIAAAIAYTAMEQGRVDRTKLDPTRFGVEFGSGLIAIELDDLAEASRLSTSADVKYHVDLDAWGEVGRPTIQPTFMLKYLPNFLACHVSMLLDAQGPNNSVTESDAASLLALGEALRILQRGDADFFLVGGAESKVNPLSLVRQSLIEHLSRRNEEPTRAHRPFDRDRDGFVLAEGGAVLVFETLDHAEKRGATIYGEVLGFGAAFDVRRDGAGLARAIHAALKEAGVRPDDIDHINAHGTATLAGDVMEAAGFHRAFGERVPPVVAYKGHLGNLGAGSNLTELALSLLAVREGFLPGTLNHETADPGCLLPVVTGPGRDIEKPTFLKVSYTNLGQCGAAVVRGWKA